MVLGSRKRFLFIHVPKCGGDSIREVLTRPGNGGVHFLRKHGTFAQATAELGDGIAGLCAFSVVRNPFAQVLSFYEHLRKPLSMSASDIERQYPGSGGRLFPFAESQLAMQVEFGEFVRRVYGAPGGPKPVFADQCSFLGDGIGAAGVGRILRFERLHEDFVALAEELGIEGELPWRNASAAPRGAHAYRDRYEPDVRSIVERHFRPTLERFGYCF